MISCKIGVLIPVEIESIGTIYISVRMWMYILFTSFHTGVTFIELCKIHRNKKNHSKNELGHTPNNLKSPHVCKFQTTYKKDVRI